MHYNVKSFFIFQSIPSSTECSKVEGKNSNRNASGCRPPPPLLRSRTLPAIVAPGLNILQAQIDARYQSEFFSFFFFFLLLSFYLILIDVTQWKVGIQLRTRWCKILKFSLDSISLKYRSFITLIMSRSDFRKLIKNLKYMVI